MKLYVANVEALRKKERQGAQIFTKIDDFLSFLPTLNPNVFLFRCVFK
jgi:hypothetical protein